MDTDVPQHDLSATPTNDTSPTDHHFPIIGIGASAGGLRAVQEFFAHVPADSGIAFVVIIHLSPDHESNIAALLQPHAALPTTQVQEPVRVEPNHIYVIPPAQQLAMNDGTIRLSPLDGPRSRRAPIDLFFRSLAETHADHAGAVVLSGTGSDGSIGLQRVKECGGVTMVQEPREAEFDGMPRSAIATGLVDFVQPVAAMADVLIGYWRNAETVRLPAPQALRAADDDDTLGDIFAVLRTRTGHDFTQYKHATVLRRMGRRMQVNSVNTLPAYLNVLRARPEEVQSLLRDLLISVTNFFRDHDAWQAIQVIVPQLFAGKGPDDQVRVWVAACATGEEAYSVAILLQEYAQQLEAPPTIQIFASDIDEDAVVRARHGVYPETIGADVSPERLARFFTLEQRHYRIKDEIRDKVLFATHNLLRDPPFSRLDLITCRNLLIYLNRALQEQILQLFHFTLRSDGYLLLGSSETTDGLPHLFTPVNKMQRLFQRRAVQPSAPPPVPSMPLVGFTRQRLSLERNTIEQSVRSLDELDVQLLTQYAPPTVIVNEDYDILYLARGAGRFLARSDGVPSNNLLREMHPGIRIDLRSTLLDATQHNTQTTLSRVRMDVDGTPRLVNIVVQPISEPEWARGHLLVLFNDVADATIVAQAAINDVEPLVRQLETELQHTRGQLRTTVEQYETAVEEYKAANEELQAVNEELRAAGEELETSKEELQSVNEELTTVNHELKDKIDEVSQTNNDLQNLMVSTEIGTLFVDRALQIKRYTPSAQMLFNLIPADINRPLAHVTHELDYNALLPDAQQVLDTLVAIEREVQHVSGHWYLARLRPYRTHTDRIDGVVLTFVDISARKHAEEELRASEERLRLLIESVQDYAIFTVTPDNIIASWNTGAQRIFGYTESEIVGQSGAILFTPEDRANDVPQKEIETAREHGSAADERWHIRKDGSRFYASGTMTPLGDNGLRGFAKVARDLTGQKQAEETLRQAHDGLEVMVNERTAALATTNDALQKVNERTAALATTNDALQAEIARRVQAEQARQELVRRIVNTQEEERRRVARELHDQMGQSLSALRLGLAAMVEDTSDSTSNDDIARLQVLAAQIDEDVDRLALELRPSALDNLGLFAALQQHVAQWSHLHHVAADVQTVGAAPVRLSSETEVVLYRVVQEALTNVAKHARALQVSVVLEQRSDQTLLLIEDDGRGFDPGAVQHRPNAQRHLGLLGMQERVTLIGGTLTIESSPGGGTTLYVRVPLAP